MKSEKFAWLVSIVLVALLAFQIPGTLAHRDDDYSFARTLIDIHRQVMTNYVEQPDDQKLQQGAIDGMLSQLDPFTNYVPPANQEQFDNMLDGSFRGVGIRLDQVSMGTGALAGSGLIVYLPDNNIHLHDEDTLVVSPIDGSPAAKEGVEAGDIIFKVNGEEIRTQKIADVMKKVKGPLGSKVTLTVRHDNGKFQELTMARQDIIMPTIKGIRRRASAVAGDSDPWDYWVSTNPKIGYIRITQFTNETFASVKKVCEDLLKNHMQGLVLDLRFNPGGRLEQAKEIANLFVREGVIVKVRGRNRPEEVTYAKKENALPDFPMVVLVNEHSASASEIVAGSLKDNNRALIVGTRSYGKGSVQELIQLEGNGGELKLTVAYYYLPSGRLVHRKKDSTDWGVDPQLNVPISGLAEEDLKADQAALDMIPRSSSKPTHPEIRIPDRQLEAGVDALVRDIDGKNLLVPPVLGK